MTLEFVGAIGRYCRAGRRVAARLLGPRRHDFLDRGFDPLEDAIEYGRELIPLVRQATAERAVARSA